MERLNPLTKAIKDLAKNGADTARQINAVERESQKQADSLSQLMESVQQVCEEGDYSDEQDTDDRRQRWGGRERARARARGRGRGRGRGRAAAYRGRDRGQHHDDDDDDDDDDSHLLTPSTVYEAFQLLRRQPAGSSSPVVTGIR